MMSQTHVAGGVLFAAAGIGAAEALGVAHVAPAAAAACIVWGGIAGDLPDIDHPDARISTGGVAFGPIGVIFGLPARVAGHFLRAPGVGVHHRGPTHSLVFLAGWSLLAAPLYAAFFALAAMLGAALIGAVAPAFNSHVHLNAAPVVATLFRALPTVFPYAVASTALGYLSHLVLDSMTNVPVPWLWLFNDKRYSLLPKGLRITTGSEEEVWGVRPLIVIAASWAAFSLAGLPLAQHAIFHARTEAEGVAQEAQSQARHLSTEANGIVRKGAHELSQAGARGLTAPHRK